MTEQTDQSASSAGKRIANIIVRFVLPLALTVALVWYMFSKVSFSQVIEIIRQGVNYWWILLAMGISVVSHVFRAARWRLQLTALGIKPPFMALCCSIFGTYALNLVFPRLGEVWRCAYISQRQKAPLTTVLGSMVADRLSDTLTVLLITLFTFVVAAGALFTFLDKYPVGQGLIALLYNPIFWIGTAVCLLGVWALFRFGKDSKIVKKIKGIVSELWNGFIVVLKMKGRGRFLLLTGAIWGCYFLQLYVAFFAFSFTEELCTRGGTAFGLVPCLVAFVFSSIGMAIPSNGGLGPWNIAVMFGLAIYGIPDGQGTAFSVLVWSAQTVMLIILGIYTMIYISATRKGDKEEAPGLKTLIRDKNEEKL